jgi:glycosyltransferase involved in cell wall biosynthesis
MKTDISCILALHAEGLIAHKTIRAINRAVAHAEKAGLATELVVVLDKATPETRRYIENSRFVYPVPKLISTDLGDLGLVRNVAIEHSSGGYIAVLDGDDLISENWLTRAYEVNRLDSHLIVHPELCVYFDQKALLFYHPNQISEEFDAANLIVENYWISLCFSRRETFLQIPYVATPKSLGFGYEDWHWNCEVMARGFVHTIARGTAHFIRVKLSGSLNAYWATRKALVRHSTLFDTLATQSWRKKTIGDHSSP